MSARHLRKGEAWLDDKLELSGVCCGDIVSGIFGGGDTPPAPDYTPVAQASKEAAEISAALGREQLAENKRQYDLNQATLKPMIDTSIAQQKQAYEQGAQNYDRMVTQGQPIQDQMKTIAMGGDYNDAQKAQQEESAGKAIADARAGNTQQMNGLVRQGLRYGWSPERMASMSGAQANQNMSAQVAAANGAREQTKAQQWGKMGDTYNTYAGLGSQAPSFYSAGTGAGQAGSQSQLGASGQYMNGVNAGTATQMQGQGLKVQGLGSVLNAQQSAYNAGIANSGGGLGSLLGLAQVGMQAYSTFSDERLKQNIELVGEYKNGLPMYEFEYLDSKYGEGRFRGVMAQDVIEIAPEAIVFNDDGYMMVRYDKLGIQMEKVS